MIFNLEKSSLLNLFRIFIGVVHADRYSEDIISKPHVHLNKLWLHNFFRLSSARYTQIAE